MKEVQATAPAVAFVGRHNSGKTTLLEKVISNLTARGVRLATVKHHGHPEFDIDVPGKDSYRHRMAGAVQSVIVSSGRFATVRDFNPEVEGEMEAHQILNNLKGFDMVIVEGFRTSGIPSFEIFRQASERDCIAAEEFLSQGTVRGGVPLGVVTDRDDIKAKAAELGMVAFDLNTGVDPLCDYLCAHFLRPRMTVVIQAGGQSRRMGQSKALVPFLGDHLINRIVTRLGSVADELLVTTNEAEKLGFLLERTDYDIRLVPDICKERGALGGLMTAMDAASNPYVAVVACDMVFASSDLLLALVRTCYKEHLDAVIPSSGLGEEPFHAVYRRDTCLNAIRPRVEAGEKRARSFYQDINMRLFTIDEVVQAEQLGARSFLNVNTPEELNQVESSIRGCRMRELF